MRMLEDIVEDLCLFMLTLKKMGTCGHAIKFSVLLICARGNPLAIALKGEAYTI